MRADQIGREIEGEPVTPELTRLSEQSLTFDHAISTAPWTTPSMISMMTGHPAPAHGVERHDRALAADVELLAERFERAGYRTAALLPAVTLREDFGFARGFEVFDLEDFGHERVSSPALSSKTLHQLETWSQQPFFIWVHLWDPHYNYRPRPPHDTLFRRGRAPEHEDVQRLKWREGAVNSAEAEYLLSQYEGEVHYTDGYVGRLLDELETLGIAEETLVVVVGDHGEAFNEHGWLGHTNRVDEVTVHVPLMLRWPGRIEPGSHEPAVSTAQLGRTILELVGLDSSGFGSVEALPVGTKGDGDPGPVITRTLRRGCLTALVDGRYKLVVEHCACRERVFDLASDPGETRDIAAQRPELTDRLRDRLRSELERIDGLGIEPGRMPESRMEETRQALAALGYLAPGSGEGLDTCEQVEDRRLRDSFGDLVRHGPCPDSGALRCLSAKPNQ
jgi:arylsulfatase A-like enzyme